MTTSRPRAYCVGLAKSGTHSVAEMLRKPCVVDHEPDTESLLPLLSATCSGRLPVGSLRSLFVERDRRLALDLESSHLLWSFAPHLVDAFPDARFILLVRDCRSWINSMINDQLNLRSWNGYARWKVVYDEYIGPVEGGFSERESLLQELNLYPLDAYIRSWRKQVTSVVNSVDPENLLVLRTDALAASQECIATFLDIPSVEIDGSKSHVYKTPKKHQVLERVGFQYVDELIDLDAAEDRGGITSKYRWAAGLDLEDAV